MRTIRTASLTILALTTATLLLAAPTAAQVTNTNTGETFGTIQAAIDDADTTAGHTIEADGGTYSEDVTVDKGLVLTAVNPADDANPAVIDGLVDVTADDAVVERFRIAPTAVQTTDVNGGHGVLVSGASGVTVRDNVIEGLRGDATANPFFSLHGIQIFSCDAAAETDVTVRNNRILDLDNAGNAQAYGGGIGIKIQGNVSGVTVAGNTVQDIHSAGWAFGVTVTGSGGCPATPPAGIVIEQNTVTAVNDGSVYDVSTAPLAAPYPGANVEVDDNPGADASEVTATCNNLAGSPLGGQNKEAQVLDAETNWWGAEGGPSGEGSGGGSAVTTNVDYQPFLSVPIERAPECGGSPLPVTEVPTLSRTAQVVMIALLLLATGWILRRAG